MLQLWPDLLAPAAAGFPPDRSKVKTVISLSFPSFILVLLFTDNVTLPGPRFMLWVLYPIPQAHGLVKLVLAGTLRAPSALVYSYFPGVVFLYHLASLYLSA